jgi:hypothetical protein
MRKPKERGTGFLNFLTKIPGEIRLHVLIRRRAGKLALRLACRRQAKSLRDRIERIENSVDAPGRIHFHRQGSFAEWQNLSLRD